MCNSDRLTWRRAKVDDLLDEVDGEEARADGHLGQGDTAKEDGGGGGGGVEQLVAGLRAHEREKKKGGFH